MAPAKEIAKKAAKKVAKKAAKKSAKHHESRDVRRAFEHLGRVEILRDMSEQGSQDVATLVSLAQSELKLGGSKAAADLLRAAEHLSFAGLGAGRGRGSRVSEELKAEIASEVDHLMRKAEEHAEDEGERYGEAVQVYEEMLQRARSGVAKGAFRPALELARGAEALTHVFKSEARRLEGGSTRGRLER